MKVEICRKIDRPLERAGETKEVEEEDQVQWLKFMSRLCGYCERGEDPIISNFTQLHRSSFNLEFVTLCESI